MGIFERFSTAITRWTGSVGAFVIAFTIILGWLVTGPMFDYSDTWQLVINTATTIITFLMVFVIQQSANKETLAIQAKLNEIIKSLEKADDGVINLENRSEKEVKDVHDQYGSPGIQ